MDVVGSEIGQKMRSAIKAKLTELGCYVDDELPDYVMVMVANKRTRAQMEDDLQLFLGDNTELFVNWLHQVLKKLQEVTVTAPLGKATDTDKAKDSSSKEKKSKDKKDKDKSKKSESSKKSKKKDKDKIHKKKEAKKVHKSKKKSKRHEMIRPNIPPLLMNMEKDSEPSITDVFAGQILKNHGITLDTPQDPQVDPKVDVKPPVEELKRPILPIIDPATISTEPEPSQSNTEPETVTTILEPDVEEVVPPVPTVAAPREDQIKEMNDIEAKIQGLKQKLAEQLDSMSDDEDFLTIRTEAEELMNDFAEDVYQEISQAAPPSTPPITRKSPSPKPKEPPKEVETLPQIELKLPKRPVRERLGARAEKQAEKEKEAESPERFTPEREPERPHKSARSRLNEPPEKQRKTSTSDEGDKSDSGSKRVFSKVSVLERAPRCASVVRVRPRPRVAAPSNSLLLRAVADAHKSLLNIPPKVDSEPAKVKRALVKPMRRCVDAQKIVIHVQADTHDATNADEKKNKSPIEKDDFTPALFTKKIINTDYVPPRSKEPRTSSMRDDTLVIETINIHNPTVDKQKDTQFIVTMDGCDPNMFLTKKLLTEGLLDDDGKSKEDSGSVLKSKETDKDDKIDKEPELTETVELEEKIETDKEPAGESKKTNHDKKDANEKEVTTSTVQKKRLSDTSEESDTQVIINQEADESRQTETVLEEKMEVSPPVRKRKKSPIVFDVEKKEKIERVRERTESAGSDHQVTVTTNTNTHKYDSVPSLSAAERALIPCRLFPLCRYGGACAFLHPRCKFAAACTRRNCVYAHAHAAPPKAQIASHVVPAANFKSIQPSALPAICKFYPNCVNPVCHFAHPKPCRYGKACLNKLECNFYHADVASAKWRYPV